jgi:hypothetical protein
MPVGILGIKFKENAYPKFNLSEDEIQYLLYEEVLPYAEMVAVRPGPVLITAANQAMARGPTLSARKFPFLWERLSASIMRLESRYHKKRPNLLGRLSPRGASILFPKFNPGLLCGRPQFCIKSRYRNSVSDG